MRTIVKLLRRSDEAPAREPEPAPQTATDSPPLILLVPDAVSASACRLHPFADAEAAAEFIRFWFPERLRNGLIAFWALPGEPEERGGAEAVVLLRDDVDRHVVYPYSFLDIEAALDAVRTEVASGLALERVAVYWAARVAVDAHGDAVTLTPVAAPPVKRPFTLVGSIDRRPVPPAPEESAVPTNSGPAPTPRAVKRTRTPEPHPAEWLVRQLADALSTPGHNASRAAFQGFSSPPGRF